MSETAPEVPVQFALSPALISNEVLDYSEVSSIKLYYRSVQALDPLFNVEPPALKLFLENLRKQAATFNWLQTFNINKDGQTLNLIKDYGALTYEDVKTHAQTYIGQNTRNAQNSVQIFNCLHNSLTEDGKARVCIESDQYTINGTTDGPLFLKVILKIAHIDTRATVTVIRTSLSKLDSKMEQLQDNVIEFNEFVKTQRGALSARGEKTLDLLTNLFKGYKTVADERFVKYIEAKEDAYNEGKDITEDELMDLATTKYRTLVESGQFKEPTAADQKIVALTAQLNSYKSKATNSKKDYKKPDGKKFNKKDSNKKDFSSKKGKDPWYFVPPKASEPKSKKVNDKTYHWCKNHGREGKWVIHEPKDCNAGNNNKNSDKSSKTSEGAADTQLSVAGFVATAFDDF